MRRDGLPVKGEEAWRRALRTLPIRQREPLFVRRHDLLRRRPLLLLLLLVLVLLSAGSTPARGRAAASAPVEPAAAVGQDAASLFSSAIEARRAGDFPRALAQLEAASAAAPGLAASLELGYLEGALRQEVGDPEGARRVLEGYLAAPGVGEGRLAPWAWLRLAGLREGGGTYREAAAAYLAAEQAGGSGWPAAERALAGAARCLTRAGDCSGAERLLQRLRAAGGRGAERDGRVQIAECLIATGDGAAARWRLELVLSEKQGDDAALRAYELLPGLEGSGAPPGAPGSGFASERERSWCLGHAALDNRLFEEARGHFLRLLEQTHGPADPYREKATFLIARSYLLERRLGEAREWFSRAAEISPRSFTGQEGLYYTAVCDLRAGEEQRALEILDRMAGPQSDPVLALKAARSALFLVKKRGDAQAVDWLEKRMARLGAEAPLRAQALLHLADVHRRAGDPAQAETALERALELAGPSETVHAEVALWLALLEARAGRVPEALRRCLALARLDAPFLFRDEARRLASRLAQEKYPAQDELLLQGARHLLEGGDSGAARVELEKFLFTCSWSPSRRVALNLLGELYRSQLPYRLAYWARVLRPAELEAEARRRRGAPGLERGAALLRLGQYAEAAEELEAEQGGALDRTDFRYTVAVLSLAGGRTASSLRRAEELAGLLPAETDLEALPVKLTLLLYPGHYYEAVSREAARWGLDPLLVLAVIRQESRFDPAARSGASARGLMQMLGSTARQVAEEEDLPPPAPAALYDPELSIRLGTACLGSLVRRFQGNVAAALAAYNGGEDNAARWLAAADPQDPFDLLREITFLETRDYVIRVLSNYRAYSILGEKLVGHGREIACSFVDWESLAADLGTAGGSAGGGGAAEAGAAAGDPSGPGAAGGEQGSPGGS